MDSSIQADFGHRYNSNADFTITGGEVVRADEGCGIILSGESLFFDKVLRIIFKRIWHRCLIKMEKNYILNA